MDEHGEPTLTIGHTVLSCGQSPAPELLSFFNELRDRRGIAATEVRTVPSTPLLGCLTNPVRITNSFALVLANDEGGRRLSATHERLSGEFLVLKKPLIKKTRRDRVTLVSTDDGGIGG